MYAHTDIHEYVYTLGRSKLNVGKVHTFMNVCTPYVRTDHMYRSDNFIAT